MRESRIDQVLNVAEQEDNKNEKENEKEIVKIEGDIFKGDVYIYNGFKLILPRPKSDKDECEYADIFYFGNKIEDASVLADCSSFWTKGGDDGQLDGEVFPEKKFRRDSNEDMLEFFTFFGKEYEKYYNGLVSKTRHGEITSSRIRHTEKMQLPEETSRDYYASAEVACHTVFEKFYQLKNKYDPRNEKKLVDEIYRKMKDSLKDRKYEEVLEQEEKANILIEKILSISTEIENALEQEKYSRCPGCGESLELEEEHICSYKGQEWFKEKYPDLPLGYMDRTDFLPIGEEHKLLLEIKNSDSRYGGEYSICVKIEEKE